MINIVEVKSLDELLGMVSQIIGYEEVEQIKEEAKMSDRELHAEICSEIHTTFIEKNERYGNSFSEQFSEFGMQSVIIRLSDKLNRLKTLTKNSELDNVRADESMYDTLMDLSNYSIMAMIELEKQGYEK